MQKRDEEALKAELYKEIGQIKAELAQQKKINFPLVVLSTISTGIIVPITVWIIENFLAKQTWPITIQITGTGQPMPLVFFVITMICTELFLWWVIYRITHPFRCSCGYSTWFSGKFKRHFNNHVAQKKKPQ